MKIKLVGIAFAQTSRPFGNPDVVTYAAEIRVKFLPDGTLDRNPAGMALAGRVAKGMDQRCIARHSGADGDDMVFTMKHLSR